MEVITKSVCVSLLVSSVDTYAHVSEFHMLMDCSMANIQEEFSGILQRGSSQPMEFPSNSFFSIFHLFQQCDRCLFLLLRGGFEDLPAMGAVFIQELAFNSGSSWISQTPNLHFSDAVKLHFFYLLTCFPCFNAVLNYIVITIICQCYCKSSHEQLCEFIL